DEHVKPSNESKVSRIALHSSFKASLSRASSSLAIHHEPFVHSLCVILSGFGSIWLGFEGSGLGTSFRSWFYLPGFVLKFLQMSEASRQSRVTITLGRTGQVVSRDGSDLDGGLELPRVGTKRSVKERLGNPLDSSVYRSDAAKRRSKFQWKWYRYMNYWIQTSIFADFSDPPLFVTKICRSVKMISGSNCCKKMHRDELRAREAALCAKLSRSEQPPRSLDTQPPHMAEPRDSLLPPSRTARGSSQMLSSANSHTPWNLDDIRRRSQERYTSSSRGRSSPERYVETSSRGRSPPKNAGSISGTQRSLSPSRNSGRIISAPRGLSPPRNASRIIGDPRDLSPPRSSSRMIVNPRDLSPPQNAGRMIRDLSPPPRNTRALVVVLGLCLQLEIYMGSSRGFSPPRNPGSYMSSSRGSPPSRNPGSYMDSSRGSPPSRNSGSYMGSSRGSPPSRNLESYMGSSRGSPPYRNPGSYMASSRGSPPSSNIDDFRGRGRMLDDVRAPPYAVRGVLNSQAPASSTTFARPMLPPPVPNPHPLPPLSQLPPLGSITHNNHFSVEEPLTVDSFLHSIGLGKYTLAFKREEVDMTTIKQMKESDLKDLIIPMEKDSLGNSLPSKSVAMTDEA
ncbi:unnamed protein product, partial [Thlaspi arvense]